MDEVIADVMPKFLDQFEKENGYRPKKEEYWGKKLYELEGIKNFRHILHEKGFFRDLPVMQDSQKVVKWLQENYEIFVISAAMEFPNSLIDKYHWMQDNFPFISWKNYIFSGHKHFMNADYLIDDHEHNLLTFSGKGLLYTSTHNIHENRFTRVNNWEEVRMFFENELKNGK